MLRRASLQSVGLLVTAAIGSSAALAQDPAQLGLYAALIAQYLGVGIEDSSEGRTVVREAGTLDMSLREKLRANGKELKMPKTPKKRFRNISMMNRRIKTGPKRSSSRSIR